jgi:hydrogenase/urease accessory protein HupE
MMRTSLTLILLCQSLLGLATAHELRPAYLDMRERTVNEFDVLWKVPALGDLRLGLYVRLPDSCRPRLEPVRTIEEGAYFERWKAICPHGLTGQRVSVDGLRTTITDVLVRIEYQSGVKQVARLTPQAPEMVVSDVRRGLEVARTYFLLGVDHILNGLDHLLFVLGLILLIRDRWMLLKTITAFTLAHSVTLAASVLGYLSLPQKPVEASIALSIAFVASELVKMRTGEIRFSQNYPWVLAFAFGLLHGLGFAGALRETGLPQIDVPLALLTFNLGVEAGQLLFVAVVLVTFGMVSYSRCPSRAHA